MKKITLVLILIALNSCSKNCRYNKADLEKQMVAEITAAGSNWQKIDLIIQKYEIRMRDAC